MTPEARDLIDRLLCMDPSKRLGSNGSDEIKEHPFFEDIDWGNLLTQEAVFVPKSVDVEDTEYFSSKVALLLTSGLFSPFSTNSQEQDAIDYQH